MNTTTPPAELATLRWTRFEAVLRNVRNLESRANPLLVLPAIFKFACHGGFPVTRFYCLRPAHPLPARVSLHDAYAVRVLIAGDAISDALLLQKGLRQHLDGPGRNYTLDSLSPPECHSWESLAPGLAQLRSANPAELCLDFLTPLPPPPTLAPPKWRVDGAILRNMLAHRLKKVLGPDAPEPPPMENLRTLPYFLRQYHSRHQSKSNGETVHLDGLEGPLYARGDLSAWLPWLLLAEEFNLAGRRGDALGHFVLRVHRPALDAALFNPSTYLHAARQWAEHSDAGDETVNALRDPEVVCQGIAADVRSARYQPEPMPTHTFPKPSGGERTIGLPAPRDRITQETLLALLSVPCERMFEDACIGYRAGRSVRTARAAILHWVRQGYEWAFESDIESFFDQIDWTLLDRALAERFPLADQALLAVLGAFARTPLLREGATTSRSRGIPQGNPLSPLLANLYLDTFDEEMAAAGHHMVRYGDDFLILTRTREEAIAAGEDAASLLAKWKLTLKPAKTGVRPLGDRFRFLGMEIGPELDEETLEKADLKAPFFIRQLYAMVGVDGDSVVVGRKGEAHQRLPIHRISELVVMGGNVVSTRLLQRCNELRIPVSFCTAAGWYLNTLVPDSRAAHEMSGRHLIRHRGLGEAERVMLARQFVQAKLVNHRSLLEDRRAPASLQAQLDDSLRHLGEQHSVEALRGAEGFAAKAVFRAVNDLVEIDVFRSPGRRPREKPDRWNALLDAVYSLLFTRLNVMVRSRGLNPYLGFLHSADSPYESLVCDLQEPFRARMDRLALKLVNRRMVAADDFEPQAQQGFRLTFSGYGKVIQAYEEEMRAQLAEDPGPLRQLLHGQILCLKDWVEHGGPFAVYQAGRPVDSAFPGRKS